MTQFISYIFFQRISDIKLKSDYLSVRYKKFISDLYGLYDIDAVSVNEKISFHEHNALMDRLLNDLYTYEICQQSDLILDTRWYPIIDPAYASYISYYHEKYRWKNNVIDIASLGMLSQFVALEMSLKLLNNRRLQTICLITAETSLKSVFKDKSMVVPEISFVSSLALTSHNKNYGIQIIDVVFGFGCEEFSRILVDKLSEDLSITSSPHFLIRDTDAFSDFLSCIDKLNLNAVYTKIKYPFSSAFLTFCINKITLNLATLEYEYAVIVDKEPSFEQFAAVIIKLKR